jgi:hypothetical protein
VTDRQNATVIAYGVTGSGKTYTMEGTPDEPGVIRQSVQHLLDKLDEQGEAIVSVQMSFLVGAALQQYHC